MRPFWLLLSTSCICGPAVREVHEGQFEVNSADIPAELETDAMLVDIIGNEVRLSYTTYDGENVVVVYTFEQP